MDQHNAETKDVKQSHSGNVKLLSFKISFSLNSKNITIRVISKKLCGFALYLLIGYWNRFTEGIVWKRFGLYLINI